MMFLSCIAIKPTAGFFTAGSAEQLLKNSIPIIAQFPSMRATKIAADWGFLKV
jgi:hypothetical protein